MFLPFYFLICIELDCFSRDCGGLFLTFYFLINANIPSLPYSVMRGCFSFLFYWLILFSLATIGDVSSLILWYYIFVIDSWNILIMRFDLILVFDGEG